MKTLRTILKYLLKHKTFILLSAVVVFGYILRWKYSWGLFLEHDDHGYMTQAYNILKGTFDVSRLGWAHFRILIYAPAAIIMKVFGINPFTTLLWHLFCSIGSIIMIFKIGKNLFGEKTAIIAALLMAVYPTNVIEIRFLADTPIVFFTLLSLYLFLKFHSSEHRIIYLGLSALVFSSSFLIRENSFIILFLFLGYILYKRKFHREYFYIIAGIGCFGLLYGGFIAITTGDFLHQIRTFSEALSSHNALRIPAFKHFTTFVWARNLLGLGESLFKYNPFFGNILIPSVLYLLIKKDRKVYIPLIWLGTLYVYYEFISITHSFCFVKRHVLTLVPFMLIIISRFIAFIGFEIKKNIGRVVGKVVAGILIVFLILNSLNYLIYRAYYRDLKSSNSIANRLYSVLKKHERKRIYSNDYLIARKLNMYFDNELFLKNDVFPGNYEACKGIKDAYFILVDNTLITRAYSRRRQKLFHDCELIIIKEGLELVESVSESINIFYTDDMERGILKGYEGVVSRAVEDFSMKNYSAAFLMFRLLAARYPENKEFIDWLQKSISALYRENSPLADLALLANGTTVESGSPCFQGYGVEKAIDGVVYSENDYLAARHDTLPNWFVLDFNMERTIHDIEIKWFAPELHGIDWKLEYFNGTGWKLLREEKNWSGNDRGLYYYKLLKPVRAVKLKMTLFKAAGQDRMLIERFSVDYAEARQGE